MNRIYSFLRKILQPGLWAVVFWLIYNPPEGLLTDLMSWLDGLVIQKAFPFLGDFPLITLLWLGLGLGLFLKWAIGLFRERPSPRLSFGEAFVETYEMADGHSWKVVSVEVLNKPKSRTAGEVAKDVSVELETRNIPDDDVLTTGQFARWNSQIQPGHPDAPSNISDLRYFDLQPHGAPEVVNLVMKADDSADCFTLTHESWFDPANAPEDRRIVGHDIVVRATIKASNAKSRRKEFVIYHDGVGSSLSVE